jgi:hypothetical protein
VTSGKFVDNQSTTEGLRASRPPNDTTAANGRRRTCGRRRRSHVCPKLGSTTIVTQVARTIIAVVRRLFTMTVAKDTVTHADDGNGELPQLRQTSCRCLFTSNFWEHRDDEHYDNVTTSLDVISCFTKTDSQLTHQTQVCKRRRFLV